MSGERPIRLTLRDGRVAQARPLEPSDRAGLASAIAPLSDDSRYERFAAAKPRVSERELDYLLDIDHHDREALVGIDPRTRRGVAVADTSRSPVSPAPSKSPRRLPMGGKGTAWVARCSRV